MKNIKTRYRLLEDVRSLPFIMVIMGALWFFGNSILINYTLTAYNEIRKEHHHEQDNDGFNSSVLLEEEESIAFLHCYVEVDESAPLNNTFIEVPYLKSHENPSADQKVPPPRILI